MIGIAGKILLLIALTGTALSGYAYLKRSEIDDHVDQWKRYGRYLWALSALASTAAFGLLIFLNVTHQFQYAYVYEHTSVSLPLDYLVAASWAGQEGSFLLWIVMSGFVGLAVIRLAKAYEGPVMAVMALSQFFLLTMVAGLDLGAFTLGISPFVTLIQKFPSAPMIQAGIIPTDGQGLNDLLQNYWMVIHPPILFSGFAAMMVPFAFAITALWKKRYTQWVRPALPWTLFGVLALGIGIILGGYWAYITLSFGGYWAWDPVENSSLVPWLVGIGAVHTMIIQKRSGHSQKASLFLCILAYILVIYSTFLTRSGILGDISVHSFVDLGLYNQLLVWILTIGIIGFGLFVYRMKELPVPENEPELLSREFLTFAGAMILMAVAAVVLLGTSAPIIGRIFRDNPSSVPLAFYNRWTLPLMILVVFLAGIGQLFWWNRMTVANVNKVMIKPVLLSLFSTLAILIFSPFSERAAMMTRAAASTSGSLNQASLLDGLSSFWSTNALGILLLLLTFVAFFAFYGNLIVFWRVVRGNLKMAGGSLAHVGFAVFVLGIIASSGFSNPIVRDTGVQIGESRDNFILALGETRVINGYTVSYTGHGTDEEGKPTYELEFVDPRGRSFTSSPVVYKSSSDQWIQNPDTHTFLEKDLFITVTPNIMFSSGDESGGTQLNLARGDSAVVGDNAFLIKFVDYDVDGVQAHQTDSTEIAVGAVLEITNLQTLETRELKPVYMIMQNRSVNIIPVRDEEWGLALGFTGMNVDNGAITLQVEGIESVPEDWLVVQASEKPFINFVWIGFIILSFGFCLSIYRRALDVRFDVSRGPRAG
ncbi:MAG: cytochrome c biogenesis protein CcsA [Bacteroidetes bacterium]|nr:cytochrome c biogenesis protein CcsA [Bacteroidota bacterium]